MEELTSEFIEKRQQSVIEEPLIIYNWTRSTERYNHENILVTDSATIFKAFEKEFQSLWNELERYA